ncbi:DUF1905 domain-containing protein [Sphingobium nicotianae]|uniref:DUF1905 domain-containing protein n=1 Tax=Sphingobium nicotianae TaxID=2782607 RepID=UPI0032D8DC81
MEQISVEGDLRVFRSASENSQSHYIVIAGEAADAIRYAAMSGQWLNGKRGFGSARVTVTVGETIWQTSVFPEKESGGWFLPIKVAVCRAEGLCEGDMVCAFVAL